jgi:UDP-N-acetylmuramyl pentapeptide synthase
LGEGHKSAVVELGINHPGEMARLSEIAAPDVAVVTKVGGAHRAFFPSEECLAREKMRILDGLKKGGRVVLPGTDKRLRRFARGRSVMTFGSGPSQVGAKDVRLGFDRTSFTLRVGGRGYRTYVRLLGAHQVDNALAAVAAGLSLGLDVKALSEGFVNDAYNASPVSMEAALDAFAALGTKGRKAAVFGDMRELGRTAAQAHGEVLEEALGSPLDALVLVGADFFAAFRKRTGIPFAAGSRVELLRMRDGAVLTVAAFADASAAGVFLRSWAKKGDAVLLKGSRAMAIENALTAFKAVRN